MRLFPSEGYEVKIIVEFFDIRTALVLGASLTLVVSVLLFATAHTFLPQYRSSLRWWAFGCLCEPLGLVLLAGRGMIDDTPSILGGNTLTTLGVVALSISLARFRHWHLPLFTPIALTLTGVAITILFGHIYVDFNARVIAMSLLFAVIAGFAIRALTRRSDVPLTLGGKLMTAVFLSSFILLLARAYSHVVLPLASGTILQASPIQTLSITWGALTPLLGTVLLLVMCAERARSELERSARIDYLTGVPNRRSLEESLKQAFSHMRRHRQSLALMIVDIDHFKRINDSLGHAAGDEALIHTVTRIREHIRNEDILSRIGGEEFVVVVPGADIDEGMRTAERIRHAFSDKPILLSAGVHAITVSIGVATLQANDTRFDSLLLRADEALYEAKRNGRNQVVFASPANMQRANQLKAIEKFG